MRRPCAKLSHADFYLPAHDGRMAILDEIRRTPEIFQITVPEVAALSLDATDRLWLRGGSPDSYLAANDAESFDWRRALMPLLADVGAQPGAD